MMMKYVSWVVKTLQNSHRGGGEEGKCEIAQVCSVFMDLCFRVCFQTATCANIYSSFFKQYCSS